MKLEKPNRLNKHKDKKSSGCGLCKPHKHGGRAMKDKQRVSLKADWDFETEESRTKRYIEGYKKYPEKDDPEIKALMLMGLKSFSLGDNWEAEWVK